MEEKIELSKFINNYNMKDFFLDDFQTLHHTKGKEEIIDLVANELLGLEQYSLIRGRYADMASNFDCVTRDAKKYYSNDVPEWNFSQGLTPHSRNKDGSYYQDTSSVPIKITHKLFKSLRSYHIEQFKLIRAEKLYGAVVGLDLPVWFNLKANKRIMIVAQDPLRNPKWYHECDAAIVSSPFGQHSREHRDKRGQRFTALINLLIKAGYGIYLTDAHKYFVSGWEQTKGETDLKKGKKICIPLTKDIRLLNSYSNILLQEIEIVNPELIVAMGNEAQKSIKNLLPIPYDHSKILNLTHFSGAAQGKIINSVEYQKIKNKLNLKDDTILTQAKAYTYAIINHIEF